MSHVVSSNGYSSKRQALMQLLTLLPLCWGAIQGRKESSFLTCGSKHCISFPFSCAHTNHPVMWGEVPFWKSNTEINRSAIFFSIIMLQITGLLLHWNLFSCLSRFNRSRYSSPCMHLPTTPKNPGSFRFLSETLYASICDLDFVFSRRKN